jgi:hypothetical protein
MFGGFTGVTKNEFGKEKLSNHMEECAICLVDYSESDEIACLDCSELHFFHKDCLRDWLKKNTTCPLCNAVVKKA